MDGGGGARIRTESKHFGNEVNAILVRARARDIIIGEGLLSSSSAANHAPRKRTKRESPLKIGTLKMKINSARLLFQAHTHTHRHTLWREEERKGGGEMRES